jgi:hypothetical protein
MAIDKIVFVREIVLDRLSCGDNRARKAKVTVFRVVFLSLAWPANPSKIAIPRIEGFVIGSG